MVADVPVVVNEDKINTVVPITSTTLAEPFVGTFMESLTMPPINCSTHIELTLDRLDWTDRDSRTPSFIEHPPDYIDYSYDSDGWDPTVPDLYDSCRSSPSNTIEESSELSPPRLRRENAIPRCDNLSVTDKQFVDDVLNMRIEHPYPRRSCRAQDLATLLEAGAVSDLLESELAIAGEAPTAQPTMQSDYNLLNLILQDADIPATSVPINVQPRESRRDNIICAPEIDPYNIPQHIIDATLQYQSRSFDFPVRESQEYFDATDAAVEHIACIMGIAQPKYADVA